MSDPKKAVSSKLTGAVKSSPLASKVDPKAFFMKVNTSFPMMYREGSLDLGPLWGTLGPSINDAEQIALFLKFEQVLTPLDLNIQLPGPIAALPPAEKQRHLALLSPAPRAPPGEEEEAGSAISDQKGQIILGLVTKMRSTPAGAKVSMGQLQAFVAGQFDTLFNGSRFDFNPVLRFLLAQPEVTEEDCYMGIIRFQALLAEKGIDMDEPDMKLEAHTRKRLRREAAPKAKATPKAQPSSSSAQAAGFTPQGKKDRKVSPGLIATAVLALVGAALAWVVLNPVKSLDVKRYQAIFPVTDASLINGTFVATLDVPKWKALGEEKQREATEKLEALLKTDGHLQHGVAIRTPEGALMVFDRKGKSLDVASETPEERARRMAEFQKRRGQAPADGASKSK